MTRITCAMLGAAVLAVGADCAATVASNPRVGEKMIRKPRAGMMPPAGILLGHDSRGRR